MSSTYTNQTRRNFLSCHHFSHFVNNFHLTKIQFRREDEHASFHLLRFFISFSHSFTLVLSAGENNFKLIIECFVWVEKFRFEFYCFWKWLRPETARWKTEAKTAASDSLILLPSSVKIELLFASMQSTIAEICDPITINCLFEFDSNFIRLKKKSTRVVHSVAFTRDSHANFKNLWTINAI